MATATITLKDNGDSVTVTLDFGEAGASNDSGAHVVAVHAVRFIHRLCGASDLDDQDEEDSDG